MLASRIVDATARADNAQIVASLLGALFGKDHGLPQNFGPSEVLSELMIAPVERRMLRAGVMTYRNNDDFRLALNTWGEALEALELLQDEVNLLGLDLNGEKSRILKRATYERNLNLFGEYFREALRADIDYQAVDPYTGALVETEEEEEGEAELGAAGDDERSEELPEGEAAAGDGRPSPSSEEVGETFTAVFNRIAAKRLTTGERVDAFERNAYRQATALALSILSSVGSDGAVDLGSHLVAVDPLLARQFAGYLRSLDAKGNETSSRVDEVVKLFRGHVPPWTLAWLIDPLVVEGAELTMESRELLEAFVRSSAPAALRARAVLALTVHGDLERKDLTRLLDEMPSVAKPDVVAALALTVKHGADADIRKLLAGDRLQVWVFEQVRERGPR